MDVLKISFNSFLGIKKSNKAQYIFQLNRKPQFVNHLDTLHASAQFALAEATSGQCLLMSFPEYSNKVVPMLRKAKIKFNKPGNTEVFSSATIPEEKKERFLTELKKRGRALVEVNVELYDVEDMKIFSSTFEWFIALRESQNSI